MKLVARSAYRDSGGAVSSALDVLSATGATGELLGVLGLGRALALAHGIPLDSRYLFQ